MRRLVTAARAELRLREAEAWLSSRPQSEETLVIAATSEAASEQIRTFAKARGSAFGLHRFTIVRLAAELAKLEMVTRKLVPALPIAINALCARVVDRLRREGKLGRFEAVADQPGLPRALARTLEELRMAGATSVEGDAELDAALRAFEEELQA